MREIRLSDTEHPNGRVEENPPIRVYDCSGPWGDPDFKGDVTQGLPALRRQWILDRGDVEEYEGREIKPVDNGYLSQDSSVSHSAPLVTQSHRNGMLSKALSLLKWNTSLSAKTWAV